MAQSGILGDVLAKISSSGRALIGSEPPKTLIEQARAILDSDGEATLTVRAAAFLKAYHDAAEAERHAFLRAMADTLGPDRDALKAALSAFARTGEVREARLLHQAGEPRSQELIRRLNRASGGTAELLAMRVDLLAIARGDPDLEALDQDFRHLFSSWFNRGFLQLRQIDWDTPASILERIIRYEAVHAIRDWRDLRRRVAADDRQLYAFFHPALPGDPLIFVEVALTRGIPDAIGPILAEDREVLPPDRADTACFYSISNCQTGLRGVSFGNFLIKTVVEELRQSFANVQTFVTLSPLPTFRRWVEAHAPGRDTDPPALETLAARYLVQAKRGDGEPVDPVARFHLGNGARLERINTDADLSERGHAQSWGVMCNYLYDLKTIERNHEAYAAAGEVATSAAVRRLLRDRDA